MISFCCVNSSIDSPATIHGHKESKKKEQKQKYVWFSTMPNTKSPCNPPALTPSSQPVDSLIEENLIRSIRNRTCWMTSQRVKISTRATRVISVPSGGIDRNSICVCVSQLILINIRSSTNPAGNVTRVNRETHV